MKTAQTIRHAFLLRRDGFSLLEVVVVISVIVVLLAVIGPAVQNARTAAQKTSCVNNLRQFGLAAQAYHETFGSYAVARPYISVLPFLEQTALSTVIASGGSPESSPTVFICSSDPLAFPARNNVSYGLNEGDGRFVETTVNGFYSKLFNGMRLSSNFRVVNSTSKDFPEGLSNTAMYSERRVPTVDVPSLRSASGDPTAFSWYADRDYSMPEEYDAFRSACRNGIRDTMLPYLALTNSYLNREFGYNHILPPNSVGCYVGRPPTTFLFPFYEGSIPATSLHTAGANVVFVDGHVRFVSNSIDMEVWSASGTRNGGETANLE